MMNMIKKLMLTLILGMIISGPAAPLFKSFVGLGSTAAYAANDNSSGNSDSREKTVMETEILTGNNRQYWS